MKSAEAVEELTARSSRQRLTAARALVEVAGQEDLPAILRALEEEADAWVRRALIQTIRRLRREPTDPAGGLEQHAEADGSDFVEDIWAEATEEMTALIVHEISPLLTAMGTAAMREVPNYDNSDTRAAIHHLRALLDAVSRLRRAASAPELREFDLTDTVVSAIREEALDADTRVQPARDDPVVVIGDEALVRLGICNGLRNAVDAISALPQPLDGRVVMNWGVTDRDTWLTINDNGIGLPAAAARVFDFGTTTKCKAEHLGLGLTIARRAMLSLGGGISVNPRANGGVSFEIVWPTPMDG